MTRFVLSVLLLLLSAALVRADKLPIPAQSAQDDSLKLIRDIYKSQYAEPSDPGKKKLASELLQQGAKTTDDPTARFVLFCQARDLSIAALDLSGAFAAIDPLDESYQIDARAMKIAAITAIAPRISAADSAPVAVKALELLDQSIQSDNLADAAKLVPSVNAVVLKSQDDALRRRFKDLQSTLSDAEKVKPALEKLKTDPLDGGANLAAGRYYCFIKGDFEKGLPLLSLGSDVKLKTLAFIEKSTPTDATKQKDLADAWFDYAQTQSGSVKSNSLSRAAFWYAKAQANLTGLARVAIDKRLDQIATLAKSTPGKAVPTLKPAIATASWSAPDDPRGIRWNRNPDSQYTPDKPGGKDAVRTSMYLYYDVDDKFAFDLPKDADERIFVKVRLFDEQESRLWIVYDGYALPGVGDPNTPWQKAPSAIGLRGAGQWIERRVELESPRFAGRLHLKTDIRLEPWKPVPPIGGITVERLKIRPLAQRTIKPGAIIDLVPLTDPDYDAVASVWNKQDGALVSEDAMNTHMMLPVIPHGDYQFEVNFTRLKGGNCVYWKLPLESRWGELCIDWSSNTSGIAPISGKHLNSEENSTRSPGRRLTDGKPALLAVTVTFQGPNVTVRSELDGQPFIQWTGPQTALGSGPLPRRGALGISSTLHSLLRIDSFKFKMLTGSAVLLH